MKDQVKEEFGHEVRRKSQNTENEKKMKEKKDEGKGGEWKRR